MKQVDPVLVRMVAASLTGILAAQRARPHYASICRQAVNVGTRATLAVRNQRRVGRTKAGTR